MNNVAVTSLSATQNTSVNVANGAVTITGPDLTSYATNTALTSTVTGIGNVAVTPTNVTSYAVTYLTTSGGLTSNAYQGAITISGTDIQNNIVSSIQGLANVAVTSLSAGTGISFSGGPTGDITVNATGGGSAESISIEATSYPVSITGNGGILFTDSSTSGSGTFSVDGSGNLLWNGNYVAFNQ